MPALREVVDEHAAFRRRLALTTAEEAASLWQRVDPGRIAVTWTTAMVHLLALLTGAQRAVAGRADDYLDTVLDAQGIAASSRGAVQAVTLSGIASDGRALATLLYQPAITSLLSIRGGQPVDQALAVGADLLDKIVRTQVADAGRAADQIATVARPAATGYVRMLVGGSCSRCVILAGRRYRWSTGFKRHPRCDCVHVPAREDTADDLRTDPDRFFTSLSQAEQQRIFTVAGAQAIRDGADIASVVNARRGMATAADGRLYTTAAAGRRPRLMPEQIYREAAGNRNEAVRLLRLHGYLR